MPISFRGPQTNDKSSVSGLRSRKIVSDYGTFFSRAAGKLYNRELLDEFMRTTLATSALQERYVQSGDEGHNLEEYAHLLELCREHKTKVQLVGGFLPRRYAKAMVKDPGDTLKQVRSLGYLPPDHQRRYTEGSDAHYNYFESLISGRDMKNTSLQPSTTFKRIFPAQVLKDNVMAAKIDAALEAHPDQAVLVLCGSGHCDHYFGVPERIRRAGTEEICIISAKSKDQFPDFDTVHDMSWYLYDSLEIPSFEHKFPGHVIFLYEDAESLLREEVSRAYDEFGSTAHYEGDAAMAVKIMTRLGYTEEQINAVGPEDIYNFQGVGCPHKSANLSAGMTVVDLGSGLGIDSFIAAKVVGREGKVIGLDISKRQVEHASRRATERGHTNIVFMQADIENIPLPDASAHRIVSNGAFCLVADKSKAFREVHRVLKSGGQFSIACTTLRQPLETGIEWPICMKAFLPLERAEPLLRDEMGFSEVVVDLSDSEMTLDLDISPDQRATLETTDQRRRRAHVGRSQQQFEHLQDYDMNRLCARVILTGTK